MQNDSSKHIRLKKLLNRHQCLLSDGFFKHSDPEFLIEQKMTTEHKKVTNNLRFKPCRQAYDKGVTGPGFFPRKCELL